MNFIQKLFRSKNVGEPINSALNKPAVIRRASYDQSTKEFEVLRITYRWDKYTRKLSNEPKLEFKALKKIQGLAQTGTVEAIWSNHKTNYDNVQVSLF